MKKLYALVALLLCVCLAGTACADIIDLSYVEDSPLLTLDVESHGDMDVAFIESTLSVSARSFVHKYESETKYSHTFFDILITDYRDSSQEDSAHRLWIYYHADNGYQNIDSVTFNVAGTRYTFTGVSSPSRCEYEDGVYEERLLIKFSVSNMSFLSALEQLIPTDGSMPDADITMTLHGKEDITVELGSGFMLDFMGLRLAMLNTDCANGLRTTTGTPMTVK